MRKLIALITIFLLSGCNNNQTYFSKASYFNDNVIVEYQTFSERGTNDYLTFKFYETGLYNIKFSKTPGKSNWADDKMPEDFSIDVTRVPHEKIIRQSILPGFLRITIEEADTSKIETNDFQ